MTMVSSPPCQRVLPPHACFIVEPSKRGRSKRKARFNNNPEAHPPQVDEARSKKKKPRGSRDFVPEEPEFPAEEIPLAFLRVPKARPCSFPPV